MIFNRGFLCPTCGPIPKAEKKTKNKIPVLRCPDCEEIVKPWERPLNERAGRCGNCANASFKSAMVKGHMVRFCKKCNEAIDIDDNYKIVRKGDSKHEYKQPTK